MHEEIQNLAKEIETSLVLQSEKIDDDTKDSLEQKLKEEFNNAAAEYNKIAYPGLHQGDIFKPE